MKTLVTAVALAFAVSGAAYAQTAPAAPAAAASAKLSVDSTVSALVGNAKSRAVLEKHLPIIVEYADMIPEGTTLKQVSEMAEAQGIVTPEIMKAITAELGAL